MDSYRSFGDIVAVARETGEKISTVVMKQQAVAMECREDELYQTMKESYLVMEESITKGLDKDIRSTSGLTGGDGYRVNTIANSLVGGVNSKAIAYALAVAEYNASMGKIVATPTAGSCGVLPAVLFSLKEKYNYSEEDSVMAIFTAAAVGMVIANMASVSGAEGGCQAEIGSASAMAAALAVELAGGDVNMVEEAVSIALVNMMGLVCDPVAGLVEIPCVMRNAAGATNALTAAEMALAGVKNPIPVDEVITAMKRVGDAMHPSLKETAQGGIAATPTGQRLFKQVFGDEADTVTCVGCSKSKHK